MRTSAGTSFAAKSITTETAQDGNGAAEKSLLKNEHSKKTAMTTTMAMMMRRNSSGTTTASEARSLCRSKIIRTNKWQPQKSPYFITSTTAREDLFIFVATTSEVHYVCRASDIPVRSALSDSDPIQRGKRIRLPRDDLRPARSFDIQIRGAFFQAIRVLRVA